MTSDDSELLGQLAEEFTTRVRQGQMPAIEEYAGKHPELAERIRSLFPTLLLLEGLAAGKPSSGTTQSLCSWEKLGPGVVFGSYRIDGEVGRGGMGAVYGATHLALDKRVALKVLPIQGLRDASALERFLREARTAAGLHHTNIVPVFDVGQVNGIPYYAMQLIEGRGLDRVLRDMFAQTPNAQAMPTKVETRAHAKVEIADAGSPPATSPSAAPGTSDSAVADALTLAAETPLPPAAAATHVPAAPRLPTPPAVPPDYYNRVAGWGNQVAEGLAYAHERGVIHRDIKPSNLILDGQNVVWITDFGLARRMEDPSLTHTGTIVGTPRYMSPEQAEAAARPIDHRTDIYSLGVSLYEMLTCRPAFDGATPLDIVMQIISRDPPSPRALNPAIPRDLNTIVQKAMARHAEDRYQTAAELAEDLRRFLKMEPIKARRTGPIGRTIRWCRRNPRLAIVTGSAAAIILVVSSIYHWNLLKENERTRLALAGEQQAQKDTLDALKLAEKHRDEANLQTDRAQDQLCRIVFDQARALNAAGIVGDRGKVLAKLKEAETLRSRQRLSSLPADLPRRADLRNEAVAVMLRPEPQCVLERFVKEEDFLLTDARAAFQNNGRQALVPWKAGQRCGWHILDLVSGKEIAKVQADVILEELDRSVVSDDGKWYAFRNQGNASLSLCPAGGKEGNHAKILLELPEELRKGKERSLNWLAFSPDSRFLAVLHYQDEWYYILLWNVDTKEVRSLERYARTPELSLYTPAFSPTGKLLAFGADKKINLWDLASQSPAGELVLPRKFGGPMSISPDDRLLVAPLQEPPPDTLALCNLQTLKIHVFAHKDARIEFSAGGKWLAVLEHKKVVLRELKDLSKSREIPLPEDFADCVRFSPDEKQLAVFCRNAAKDRSAGVIWDLTKMEERARFDATGYGAPVSLPPFSLTATNNLVVFSPSGNRLALLNNSSLSIRDSATGKEQLRLKWPHKDFVLGLSWPAEGLLTSAGTDGVKIWQPGVLNIPISMLKVTMPEGVRNMAFSSKRKWAYSNHERGQLSDRVSGKVLLDWHFGESPIFSADGRKLAMVRYTGKDRHEAVVIDVGTLKEEARLSPELTANPVLAFRPDGQLLVVARLKTGGWVIWNVSTNRPVREVTNSFVQLSRDGSLMVVPGDDKTPTTLTEVATGRTVLADLGTSGWAGFSPDGRWLMLITGNLEMTVTRVPSLDRRFVIPGVATPNMVIAGVIGPGPVISDDSRILAYPSFDGDMQVWDMERGEELFRWPSDYTILAFTPEGDLACGKYGADHVKVLQLGTLRRQLEEIGLGW